MDPRVEVYGWDEVTKRSKMEINQEKRDPLLYPFHRNCLEEKRMVQRPKGMINISVRLLVQEFVLGIRAEETANVRDSLSHCSKFLQPPTYNNQLQNLQTLLRLGWKADSLDWKLVPEDS